MAGHVFISYSQVDRDYVQRLAHHLTQAGLPIWFDHKLSAGSRFDATIQAQLDACSAVVLVLTPASVDSIWVSREIGYADDRGKPILPLLLSPVEMPLRLQNVQYENVTGGRMPSQSFLVQLRELAEAPATAMQATRLASSPPAAPASMYWPVAPGGS